jgi:hypothetical protein
VQLKYSPWASKDWRPLLYDIPFLLDSWKHFFIFHTDRVTNLSTPFQHHILVTTRIRFNSGLFTRCLGYVSHNIDNNTVYQKLDEHLKKKMKIFNKYKKIHPVRTANVTNAKNVIWGHGYSIKLNHWIMIWTKQWNSLGHFHGIRLFLTHNTI